jgi:hypothetical protein
MLFRFNPIRSRFSPCRRGESGVCDLLTCRSADQCRGLIASRCDRWPLAESSRCLVKPTLKPSLNCG